MSIYVKTVIPRQGSKKKKGELDLSKFGRRRVFYFANIYIKNPYAGWARYLLRISPHLLVRAPSSSCVGVWEPIEVTGHRISDFSYQRNMFLNFPVGLRIHHRAISTFFTSRAGQAPKAPPLSPQQQPRPRRPRRPPRRARRQCPSPAPCRTGTGREGSPAPPTS